MDRPTMSNDTALRQAMSTASTYMNDAIYQIDQVLGDGYAKKNPALIAAYMKSATEDMKTSVLFDSLYEIASGLHYISQSMVEK
jgi:hypothetical protein